MSQTLTLPLNDERILDALALTGIPYSYGAGGPADDPWPPNALPKGIHGGPGLDCNGAAQACAVRAGLLWRGAQDRSAAALYDATQAVDDGEERFGDLAFYGATEVSHVSFVLATGWVISASGGHSWTNGDDLEAYVRPERLHHHPAFRGVRRLKPEEALPRAAAA